MSLTKKLRNNNSGMILIAVSVLTLSMMIITIGIISLGTSQSISNQHQVDRIKADQLATGAWWFQYENQVKGTSATLTSQSLDGKTYTISIGAPSVGTGPNGTNTYAIQISY